MTHHNTEAIFRCDPARLWEELEPAGILARGSTVTLEAAGGNTLRVVARQLVGTYPSQVRVFTGLVSTPHPTYGTLTLDYDQFERTVRFIAGSGSSDERLIVVCGASNGGAELLFDDQAFVLQRRDQPTTAHNSIVVPRAEFAAAIPARLAQRSVLVAWRRALALDIDQEGVVVLARDGSTTTVTCVDFAHRPQDPPIELQLNLSASDVAGFARFWGDDDVHISWTDGPQRSVSLCCGDQTLQLPSPSDDGGLRQSVRTISDAPLVTAGVDQGALRDALRHCLSLTRDGGDASPSVFLHHTAAALVVRPNVDGYEDDADVCVVPAIVVRPDEVRSPSHHSVHALLRALDDVDAPDVDVQLRAGDPFLTIGSADAEQARRRHVIVADTPPF